MNILRDIYYKVFNNTEVIIRKPEFLAGYKWILDKNYGRAYFKGYYEPKLTKYICESLDERSCFIDIGSHAGYFSLLAASIAKHGSVISFEPDKSNYSYLSNIKNLNHVSNWATVNAAVGDYNGELRFRTGDSSSTGFVAQDGDVVVRQVSLDSYISLMNINKIDLIKIDVEGFAANVLKGSLETINKFKPEILLECHLGSDEFHVAWDLLYKTYNFYDFSTMKHINEFTNDQIDFVILKTKSK